MNPKLQQLDQSLLHLLKQRIDLMSDPSTTPVTEQITSAQPLLTELGIPEFIWQSLVINCTAARQMHSTPLVPAAPKRITMIGGRGMMGQFFTRRLSVHGHQVQILETQDWEYADQLLQKADLVLVCVPIESTLDVLKVATPYLEPTTTLADITSIKSEAVSTMLELHSGPVVGLHPMFGPGGQSFLSQKVVVCHGRLETSYQWLLDLIRHEGGELIFSTPEEHDRMMVAVQAIRHFTTFAFGVFLAQQNIDVNRTLEFSSPIYRLEIDMVSRLFAQDASLYTDIMSATQERQQAINCLAQTFQKLAQLVVEGDRSALIHQFEEARQAFGDETVRALQESTYIINSLSALMASQNTQAKN